MSAGAVVPAYFHPCVRGADWMRMEQVGAAWTCVVVNVADGPGGAWPVDPEYTRALGRLAAAGVRAAGYVDLEYGARDARNVHADVATWRERYGLDAVLLDRFPYAPTCGLDALVRGVRAVGARLVVANPGVHPVPRSLVGVDVCVAFEGDWAAYRRLATPTWAHRRPPCRLVHLVHGVPRSALGQLRQMVGRRGVPCYATEESGANPWRRLSGVLAGAPPRHRLANQTPGEVPGPTRERRACAVTSDNSRGAQDDEG